MERASATLARIVSARCVRQRALLLHYWNYAGNVPVMSSYTFTPMDPPNWDDLGEDEWTRVEGGELPAPVYLRIELSGDGKPVITGMVLGASWPRREITANTLRSIRPREILTELFAEYDPAKPPPYEDWEESITWGLMHEVYMMRLPRLPIESSAARGAASSDRLEEFARTYLYQLRIKPKSAMTDTAKALNISRATANRWAAAARERGLLAPPRPHASGPEQEGQHSPF